MRFALCAVFVFLTALSSAQSGQPAGDFSITLLHEGCEGICPTYEVRILADGSVRYKGEAYVHIEGIRKTKIPVSEVNKLIQKLLDEDFFHWEEKTDFCVDAPEARIKVVLKGRHKEVVEACERPGKVLTLADEIDRVSGAKTWVGNVREELMKKQHNPH